MLKTNPHDHTLFKIYLDELERLSVSAGFHVVDRIIQTRIKPKTNFLIGSGKVKELKELVKAKNVDYVIFYNSLSSKQKLSLSIELECEVIDRYELTLMIFEKSAQDIVSKLQIEYAWLRKLAPLFKLEASIKYKGEHPFFRSMGEYAFHRKLNIIKRKEKAIKLSIEKLVWERRRQIDERKKHGIPTIVLAGMYNAGKTALFNAICGCNKPVSDSPFTTLSSKYQLTETESQKMFFVDTIGFVIDLDPMLIESFKLNLLDLKSADMVVLLVALDDPLEIIKLKFKEAIRILRNIGVEEKRIVIALSKADLVDEEKRTAIPLYLTPLLGEFEWCFVSAKEKDYSSLFSIITKKLQELSRPQSPPQMHPCLPSGVSSSPLIMNTEGSLY
ncbi:MAG: GTPase [Candidatus Jordarchaeales archaeon]|nr:GTPase HflX [Candidatus Jordarchaeia archaeon]